MTFKFPKAPLLLLSALGFIWPCPLHADAPEIAPVSAEQIMEALGPDAQGLHIPAEKIPDIFTLTASRLDEDKSRFTVQQPYQEGRWKGGKVVIEYARDLSYTMVSVYDKNGHRQRIYSVVNKPSSAKARESALSSGSGGSWQPLSSDEGAGEPEELTPNERKGASPTSRRRHKTKRQVEDNANVTVVRTPQVGPAPGSSGGSGVVGFQWDDAQGAYVPIHAAGGASGSGATVASARHRRRGTSESEPVTSRRPHAAATSPSPKETPEATIASARTTKNSNGPSSRSDSGNVSDEWVPQNITPSPSSEKTSSSYSSGHKEGNDVPTHSTEKRGNTASSASDNSSKRKHHKAATEPAGTPEGSLREPSPSTTSAGWHSLSEESATSDAAGDSDYSLRSKPGGAVPSTEDLLASGPSGGGSTSDSSTAKPAAKGSRHKHQEDAPPGPSGAAAAAAELDGGSNTPPERSVKSKAHDQPPPLVADVEPSTPEEASPPSSAKRRRHDEPTPLPAAVTEGAAALDGETAPPPSNGANTAPQASGPLGPDNGGADSWSPKKVTLPPVPPPVKSPEKPIQVAMVPKKAAPDASIESLMKIAEAERASGHNEAESWSPKGGNGAEHGAGGEEALNAELARAREAENRRAVVPVVKIRRDINNPEQGVLPANSFEKFSGPRYGRHWEYERRLHLEKRVQAQVKDYDFYVDEVDRKKEIHNVYYYKHLKGQSIPRMVAVERHEHVTFLSNYDVDQDGKGKTSKYD